MAATVASALPDGTLAQSPRNAAGVPIISEELMSRLITRTLASTKDESLRQACVFDICGPNQSMPLRGVRKTLPEGVHFFTVSLVNPKDIVIAFITADKTRREVDLYLTDKTGFLRAAAVVEVSGTRLITNEQAKTKYEAELSVFADLAALLPPAK